MWHPVAVAADVAVSIIRPDRDNGGLVFRGNMGLNHTSALEVPELA